MMFVKRTDTSTGWDQLLRLTCCDSKESENLPQVHLKVPQEVRVVAVVRGMVTGRVVRIGMVGAGGGWARGVVGVWRCAGAWGEVCGGASNSRFG